MQLRICCLLIFISLFFQACKKEEAEHPELVSFVLHQHSNTDVLTKDVELTISNQQLEFVVHKEVNLSRLVASFGFVGAKVIVGGVEQESGIHSQ